MPARSVTDRLTRTQGARERLKRPCGRWRDGRRGGRENDDFRMLYDGVLGDGSGGAAICCVRGESARPGRRAMRATGACSRLVGGVGAIELWADVRRAIERSGA